MSLVDSTTGEIVTVELDQIGVDQGVRSGTLDLDHVARLGEVLDLLPPIVLRLNGERYELIDGSHRCAAHRLGGRSEIQAMVVQVSDARAVEWATSANVTHGRPLTTPDRKRAAERLMALDPELSDRSIAASCGLSHVTVAALRPTGQSDQLDTPEKRTGGDGKKRPASKQQAEQARAKAEEIAAEQPEISTRDLAEQAGVSRGTAATAKKAAAEPPAEPAPEASPRNHLRDVSATPEERATSTVGDILGPPIPQTWSKHPAAKRSNDGRDFCGWMDRRTIRGTDPEAMVHGFAEMVPGELLPEAEAAARVQAGLWLEFAATVAARRNQEAIQ